MTPTAITSEIQKLAPSARIELFEIDVTPLGGDLLRIHAGKNGLVGNIVWQGNTFNAYPVEATGFEWNGKGQLPRPTLRLSNVFGTITALVLQYQDLAGVKVTRIRTLQKYLDAVNFPGGTNPTADATAEYPRDYYFIDRKSVETRETVEFELASSLDLAGVQLPRRQIVQNYCPWLYRGTECGYAGTSYFDANDTPVSSAAQDVCGKRLTSCQARFGTYAESPYGGFVAAGLVKQ